YYQGVTWQRCQVHFMRNFISKLSKSQKKEGIQLLKDVFLSHTKKIALDRVKELESYLVMNKKGAVWRWLEENIEESLGVYELPEEHRKKMKSTNMLERFNQELKRRSRAIRTFPNDDSCLRILTALCMEQSEVWSNRCYLDMVT
ncbi:transposase, partial [Chlamydiales bacterium]|nr:transposase [Chlamydiales bacterium]